MDEQQISTEELNSNLDYFLDVDVSKHNDELLSTLITCGKQDCDVEKLDKLFQKLNYTEEEVRKYNLNEVRNKKKAQESLKKKRVSWSENLTEITEIENTKRFKKEPIHIEEHKGGPLEFDLEKICEKHVEIRNFLKELLEDKEFVKMLQVKNK